MKMREEYNERRRYLVHRFKEMGLQCFEPFGAFYIFPSIQEFGMTSEEFANRFLREEKVAVVPGTAFGACGEGFLRISYAYSLDNLKMALEAFGAFYCTFARGKEEWLSSISYYMSRRFRQIRKHRKNLCGNRNKTASDRTSCFSLSEKALKRAGMVTGHN